MITGIAVYSGQTKRKLREENFNTMNGYSMNFSNVDIDEDLSPFLSKITSTYDVDPNTRYSTRLKPITNSTFLQIIAPKLVTVTNIVIRYLFSDGIPGIQILHDSLYYSRSTRIKLVYEDSRAPYNDERVLQYDMTYDTTGVKKRFDPGAVVIGNILSQQFPDIRPCEYSEIPVMINSGMYVLQTFQVDIFVDKWSLDVTNCETEFGGVSDCNINDSLGVVNFVGSDVLNDDIGHVQIGRFTTKAYQSKVQPFKAVTISGHVEVFIISIPNYPEFAMSQTSLTYVIGGVQKILPDDSCSHQPEEGILAPAPPPPSPPYSTPPPLPLFPSPPPSNLVCGFILEMLDTYDDTWNGAYWDARNEAGQVVAGPYSLKTCEKKPMGLYL